MADFTLRKNDRLPRLQVTFTDRDGAAVNINGAPVVFSMRPIGNPAPVITNAAATNLDDGTVPLRGQAEYAWSPADVAAFAVGFYEGEFSASFSGLNQSFPNLGYLLIQVTDQVA